MTTDPKFSKKAGLWMLLLAWLIFMALMIWFFSHLLDERANPNQNAMSSRVAGGACELVLKPNSRKHYIINGAINGVKVTYLLDTGATYVAVPSSIAKKAGLKSMFESMAHTANGTVKVGITRINRLNIGGMILHDVKASINPTMGGKRVLLGMSALKNLEFRQSSSTLVITQQDCSS